MRGNWKLLLWHDSETDMTHQFSYCRRHSNNLLYYRILDRVGPPQSTRALSFWALFLLHHFIWCRMRRAATHRHRSVIWTTPLLQLITLELNSNASSYHLPLSPAHKKRKSVRKAGVGRWEATTVHTTRSHVAVYAFTERFEMTH